MVYKLIKSRSTRICRAYNVLTTCALTLALSSSEMAFVTSFTGGVLPSQRRRPRKAVCATLPVDKPTEPKSDNGGSASNEGVPRGKLYAPRQMRGGGRRLVGSVQAQGRRYVRAPPNPPGLRVSAGSARGRTLRSPDVYLRPMMGKVREALFSMLGTMGALRKDGAVLDLFAGSGSVGIEALSRGMRRAVFVDFAQECVSAAVENAGRCGFEEEQMEGVCARVEEFLKDGANLNDGKCFDLITVTPPYEEVDYAELMEAIVTSDCVGEGTFVVVEYPVELKSMPPTINNRLVGIRNRKYGRTVLAVYACQPDVDVIPRPDEFMGRLGKKR